MATKFKIGTGEHAKEYELQGAYHGKYHRYGMVKIEYADPEMSSQNRDMTDVWKNVEGAIFKEDQHWVTSNLAKDLTSVTMTHVCGVNVDWKDYPNIIPTWETGGSARNCTYRQIFEVILMEENLSRRILMEMGGKRYKVNLVDISPDDIENYLFNHKEELGVLEEDDSFSLEFYGEFGECNRIEFKTCRGDLEDYIVSIRLVEFEQIINEDSDDSDEDSDDSDEYGYDDSEDDDEDGDDE